MKRSRLLKFRLIAPTNLSEKRISVKCPIFNDWMLYVWNGDLNNIMHDQVEYILEERFGFRPEELISCAEDNDNYFVMISNFERRIIKEKNH